MQLQHMLNEKTILLNVSGRDKWQILQLLVHCLDESTDEHDGEAVLRAVMAREHCSSTGVGGGIAIPHARTDRVPTVAVALAI
ncbi:MAG: PTS sugar transporter subunit IIA, partial [Candidatus Hydrogenedentes bacterium]|nr:PTS sugar transporter subunit IIA [Candidatus Hydrogenedentota bacterium]